MTIDLTNTALFTEYTDPELGVPFHILTRKVAPLQQGFYFVNSGWSDDGRFLWFYCAHPPSPERTLGCVDFESGTVRHFPEAGFSNASPYVEPETGTVYWCARTAVWRLDPRGTDGPDLVNALPADLVQERPVHRLATHLTRSADGREFLIDAALGLQWLIGSLPLDGGDFQLWHRFDRNYNHAQFSPTDPDLVLFAEEFHSDPITGLRLPIVDRMWLIRRGEAPRPVFPEPTLVTHEWWDGDGAHVWCVTGNQAWRTRIDDASVERFEWPAHCWHAHHTADGRFLVSDSNEHFYRGCPSSVSVRDRETGRHLKICDNPGMSGVTGSSYHIDPHPRFCCGDAYVVFTTTVRGEVDLAIARTADLAERLA